MFWDIEIKDAIKETPINDPCMLKKCELNINGSFMTIEQINIF